MNLLICFIRLLFLDLIHDFIVKLYPYSDKQLKIRPHAGLLGWFRRRVKTEAVATVSGEFPSQRLLCSSGSRGVVARTLALLTR